MVLSPKSNTDIITLETITNEIQLAEQQLHKLKELQTVDETTTGSNNNEEEDDEIIIGWNENNKNDRTTATTTNRLDVSSSLSSNLSIQQIQYRLSEYDIKTTELLFVHDINKWVQDYPLPTEEDDSDCTDDTTTTTMNDDNPTEFIRIQKLVQILLDPQWKTIFFLQPQQHLQQQQQQQNELNLYYQVYNREFIPYYKYLKEKYIRYVRRLLQQSKYPSTEGCTNLLQLSQQQQQQRSSKNLYEGITSHNNNNNVYLQLIKYCNYISTISKSYNEIQWYISNNGNVLQSTFRTNPSTNNELDVLLLEFCRPFVDKMKYHFIDSTTSTNKIMSSGNKGTPKKMNDPKTIIQKPVVQYKIERLPELIFKYIRDTILLDTTNNGSSSSPWEVLTTTDLTKYISSIDFINEIIRLVQWILITHYDYFRHPSVAGKSSQPTVLNTAINEILQFDYYLRSLRFEVDNNINKTKKKRIISLFDVCVAGDEELFQWWIQYEHDTILKLLVSEYDDTHTTKQDDVNDDDNETESKYNTILYQAELVSSLLRSIQYKASIFQYSIPYIQNVAVPVCTKYIDMIQTTAQSIKKTITVPKVRGPPSTSELEVYIYSYLNVLHGIQLVILVLPDDNTEKDPTTSNDHDHDYNNDFCRYRRSLENLQDVLLEECVKTIRDNILMDRCKLASYLMRCSHFLGIQDPDGIPHTTEGVSFDIVETIRSLQTILNLLIKLSSDEEDDANNANNTIITLQAINERQMLCKVLYDYIITEVSNTLLGVALNVEEMTPDIGMVGAAIFVRDVQGIFGTLSALPIEGLRLLDVVAVMTMDRIQIITIGRTLCALADQPAPLPESIFQQDDKLYDEAISMIRAKGLLYIELSDVISILNRRRDL